MPQLLWCSLAAWAAYRCFQHHMSNAELPEKDLIGFFKWSPSLIPRSDLHGPPHFLPGGRDEGRDGNKFLRYFKQPTAWTPWGLLIPLQEESKRCSRKFTRRGPEFLWRAICATRNMVPRQEGLFANFSLCVRACVSQLDFRICAACAPENTKRLLVALLRSQVTCILIFLLNYAQRILLLSIFPWINPC